MSGAASNIVATLKSKIKETADELEKYEGVCEETRVRWPHTAAALLTLAHLMCHLCCTGTMRSGRRGRR